MQDEIVNKLNRHLSAGITREADVVYTMVEIRKLFGLKSRMLSGERALIG
jgi:hypothetical protein